MTYHIEGAGCLEELHASDQAEVELDLLNVTTYFTAYSLQFNFDIIFVFFKSAWTSRREQQIGV